MAAEAPSLRLFFAVYPPRELLARLQSLQEHLKAESWELRWTRPQDFHLTLHFLGKTPLRVVDDLQRELKACLHALRPFELSAGGLGVFPDVDKPKVLWVGIQDRHERLLELFIKTRKILSRYRLFALPDTYRPHLTLGRVKTLQGWDGQRLAGLQGDWKRLGPFPVEALQMMKTEMTSNGSIHQELFRISLGGE